MENNNYKKILVFTKYPRIGASSRLRTLQYLPRLEEDGFEFTIHSLFDESYLENLYSNGSRSKAAIFKYYLNRFLAVLSVPRYDVVWIEYELFPYLPALPEKFLALVSKKYIVDYDDAIFHNYDLSHNKFIKLLLSNKIDQVMRHSSYVLAGNSYLAKRARKAGAKNIQLVPTVVDHLRYPQREEHTESRLTVGWIGSPSTQKYVIEILPELLLAHQKSPFQLILIGAAENIKEHLPGLDVIVHPWKEHTEVELIATMDIGIMPLEDGPWEQGKCGYKLIQYMACGMPVIASAVGVNSEIVEGANSGLLVSPCLSWEGALTQLLESATLRSQYGEAGRVAVAEKYSIESQLPIIKSLLHELTR